MAVLMLVSVLPMNLLAADSGISAQAQIPLSVMENINQSDGVTLRKSVWPHEENGVPDGTVDVILEAYTTGVVTQSMKAVPTDIVLVLDVSGSMNEAASTTTTTVTTYNTATGTSWTTGRGASRRTYYGFQSESTTYYVNVGTESAPHYVSVRRVNPDSGNCYYYSYADENDNTVYVYPKLRNNLNPEREYSYSVVPFYTQRVTTSETVTATSLDVLKEAVDAFIESTHQKNVQIAAENPALSGAQLEAAQHRIAIVKFAGDQYAGGSPSVKEGDDFYNDNSGYEHNYSQVVKNLTVVNGAGHTALIDAMNGLRAVGATAIDSGLAVAQKVLEASNTGTAQRNKVVLVFSDGVPTHGSSFDTSVANTAIGTAKTIKQTAKVYAISVAKDSDVSNTTSNLNKFFHYVSSNYPNATNLNTAGNGGNASAGYYMVPTDTSSLSMMFQAIAQNIEAPTVELGESAAVVDTMSAFFTVPEGVNSVSLYTSDRIKTADGNWDWSEAAIDSSLSCTVQGKTLEVHGFDYDANYVSDTPRTKGANTEYYGTALVIKINAQPDYAQIDAHSATFADGYIPSNDGLANLLNSDGEKMASVDTPYIRANTVTYQYTDPVTKETVVYKSFYRLPGGAQSVIADTPVLHGYTFGGWTTKDVSVAADGSYTMPEGDVVFEGKFTANKHDVTYTITGYNPGASAPDGAKNVAFGTTVDVAEDLTFPGYTFTGWMSGYPTITADQANFTMPDHDVELIGYFTANSGVPYKTIHYTQNLDGTFSVKETVDGTGTTDTVVPAAVRVYEGFTLDTTVMGATVVGVDGTVDTVSEGKITADGQLTLHQFHIRNKYTVTYKYEGSTPAGAPALPETKSYYHGQTVDVESHALQDAVKDHTFAGWHTLDKTTVTDDTAEFTMPMGDITLYGHFSVKENVPFHIHHYLQNADGSYPASPNYTGTSYEVAGTKVTDDEFVRTISGYTFDPGAADRVDEGIVSENPVLILKLYYKLNKYTVTYKYEGAVPADATDITSYQMTEVPYGTAVTVGADATAVGYAFSGWRIESPTAAVISDGAFVMPASDVVLVGSFDANSDTKYAVKYYWQNASDNGFTLHDSVTYNGTTGVTVYAPEKTFVGFTLDKTVAGTKASGVVSPDGSLVLELYYIRNTYTVEYKYESQVDGAPKLPNTKTYRFGQDVTVAEDAALEHYDFHGWYTKNSAFAVNAGMTSFRMPAENLTLWGEFKRIEGVHYKAEHYLLDDAGAALVLTEKFEDGIAGETVTGTPKRFEGYVHDPAASGSVLSGTVIASSEPDYPLTLKLYYKPDTFRVIYVYEGVLPADRTPLPAAANAEYLSKVTVAPAATAAGYTFSGWSIQSPAGVTIDGNGEFVMPAAQVILVGSFQSNPTYHVEYYLQSAENPNVYEKDEAASHSHTAPVGATVSAHKRIYEGYTENTAHPDRLAEGTVPATGKLVLKLFYDRNNYTVTYVFESPVPAGATLPPQETRYFKDTVKTPVPSVEGYIFSGWSIQSPAGVEYKNGEFVMPAADVVLKGKFTAGEAAYKIEHYLMNDQGTYEGVVPHTESKTGVVGDSVRATTYQPYLDMGAHLDTAKTAQVGLWEGVVTASAVDLLVLRLYYSREPATHVIYHYDGDLTQDQWRALGWPDLPIDGTAYYVGATVTAKDFDTQPADMIFEGWYSSDPSLIVAPNGTFTVPRLSGSDPVIHLYGSWTSTLPQDFTVKYFVDNVEMTQYTRVYALNTPVTVMANIENTASHSYTPWSTPVSVTAGTEVVFNSDGTFTMTEPGEVHIYCVSVPIRPVEKYNVRYYLDGRLYWEGGYELFERHFIIDAPLLPSNVYFSGWSAPRTVMGSRVLVLNDRLGRPCFTMPADTVVLHGFTSTEPIYEGAVTIEKIVESPQNFSGKDTFTFHIYLIENGEKVLFDTVSVKVSAKTGRGCSETIYLPLGAECVVEEASSGVPGYALTTTVTDAAGNALSLGQVLTVGPRVRPTEIIFTNTYAELSLETRDHFGYIIGYLDGTVRPNDYITRAEVATIFFRLLTDEKREEFWSQNNSFSDVPANAWYNNAISTLVNAGALAGYADNTFRPENPITRAELVKIAMSFYGTLGDSPDAFNDIGEHWAAAFINAAAELGFVSGYGDDTFQPDRYVTRAEAIKIINRTLNRAPHKDHLLADMITWVDNADTDAWYYAEIQEATNSHMYYRDNTHEVWEKIRPIRDWAELEKQWSNAYSGKQ